MREETGLQNFRRSTYCAVALFLTSAALPGLTVSSAEARRPVKRATSAAEAEASQHFSRGVLALATRDFATAYREFAQAYRLTPTAELLYQLGIVTSVEGRTIEAQDLLRRYLVEAGESEAVASKRAEAERILTLPHGPVGQLRVTGSADSDVILDDRLVGRLPLSRPLLASTGAHRLAIVGKGAPKGEPKSTAVTVRAGGTTEAVMDATGSLAIRDLTTVLPLVRGRGATASLFALQPLSKVIEGENLALFDAAATNQEPLRAECWDDGSCLSQLGDKSPLDLLLHLDSSDTAGGARLKLSLLDVPGATLIGSSERTCEPCDAEAAQKLSGELLHQLLGSERRQTRGRLVVNASPKSAEVELAGWQLGRSPIEKQPLVGDYELVIKAPGYTPQKRRITITQGEPTSVELALVLAPTIAPPPPKPELRWEQQRRPIWRLALGTGALGGGAVMVGLGGWALSVNGGCVDSAASPMLACSSLYTTTGIGAGLVGAGAAVAITGAILLAIPGPRKLVPIERAAVHSGSQLAGRAAGN